MFDIALVGNGPFGPSDERAVQREPGCSCRPGHGRSALVSSGDLSRWRTELDEMSGIRWNRIHEVRAAILEGDYLTENRLDAALDGLLRDLEK
ncbi:MAG: hypothetical protein QF471_05645 [Phycisphaerales bacterium]|nr:hypothetical protein [Phycisphaerales bacterium]